MKRGKLGARTKVHQFCKACQSTFSWAGAHALVQHCTRKKAIRCGPFALTQEILLSLYHLI